MFQVGTKLIRATKLYTRIFSSLKKLTVMSKVTHYLDFLHFYYKGHIFPSHPSCVVLDGCVRDRSLGTIASSHSAKLFKDLSAKTGNGDAKVMEGRNEK